VARPLRFLLLLCLAGAAAAQPVITSPRPEKVAVTIYRAPDRGVFTSMELEWLRGFALITETRRIDVPAGEGDIRFEGVAGGIIPESAIVAGLPEGVVEKNQDAYLLSPSSLLERSLGRRVHVRRTSRATGQVTEHEAVIRSGAGGAVVLQTSEGFEALRCSGLPETIVYSAVPQGLSAKPTLSVRTRSRGPATALVTLSYLASGFDWQANYVASLSPDATRMDLYAWVTLASADETSFVDADTRAIAGLVNRVERKDGDRVREERGADDGLRLSCWPAETTSSIPLTEAPRHSPFPPPPAELDGAALLCQDNPESPECSGEGESIVVTGSRIVRQEAIGDLKLYRLPEPVTVAANSQKQVTLMHRKNVRVDTFYTARVIGDNEDEVKLVVRAVNDEASGLGLPLPLGQIAFFQEAAGRPLLLGEAGLRDRAVGEEVEWELAEATNVSIVADSENLDDKTEKVTLTVRNALSNPVWFEAEIEPGWEEELLDVARGAKRKDGQWIWRVRLPPNGTRSFSYRIRAVD
jgi:hypothetical protein